MNVEPKEEGDSSPNPSCGLQSYHVGHEGWRVVAFEVESERDSGDDGEELKSEAGVQKTRKIDVSNGLVSVRNDELSRRP